MEQVRQQVRSEARIEIRSAAWSEAHIAALHERGDCYVSLHRGEGWGYPLFEAASRGTPVIATGYAEMIAEDDYNKARIDEVIRKPYAVADVLARAASILAGQSNGHRERVLV